MMQRGKIEKLDALVFELNRKLEEIVVLETGRDVLNRKIADLEEKLVQAKETADSQKSSLSQALSQTTDRLSDMMTKKKDLGARVDALTKLLDEEKKTYQFSIPLP